MHQRSEMKNPKTQAGVTLLEVLVSMVVLAVGMLGVAGLNLLSLRTTQEAGGRAIAAQLTQEIADKLRLANPTDLATYVSTNGTSKIDTAGAPPDCFNKVCSGNDQIAHSVITWAKSITDNGLSGLDKARYSRLPDGSAVICFDSTPSDGTAAAPACDGAPNSPIAIKIWWTERARNDSTAAAAQTSTQFFSTSMVP